MSFLQEFLHGKERKTSQLCVDIVLMGTSEEPVFSRLHSNLNSRKPVRYGSIFVHEKKHRVKLVGDEGRILKDLARNHIDGTIIGVDGVTSDGINVSANVTKTERDRIYNQPERFRVQAEVPIDRD